MSNTKTNFDLFLLTYGQNSPKKSVFFDVTKRCCIFATLNSNQEKTIAIMRKIVILLIMCLLASTAWAVDIVFDATVDVGTGSSTAGEFVIEKDGITVQVEQGVATGQHYRFYKNKTVTVTSTIGSITGIVFTCVGANDAQYGPAGFTCEGYSYYDNLGIWTGGEEQVVFTTSVAQVRATKIVVTVGGGVGLMAPRITPASGTYYGPVQVSMRCYTAGAKIYYTIDGSVPTTNSTLYTAPFILNNNTTVKAISELDGVVSDIVTAEYVVFDGVYLVDNILYITSGVTSVKGLQVNPNAIYSFAAVPPECDENTFLGYNAVLHVPATSFTDYFMADYWCNFADIRNDAIEPANISLNSYEAEMTMGNTMTLTATVSPNNATPNTVVWTTSNPQVAVVDNGVVTAIGKGECDIVANCLNMQAVCHVTVVEATIQITLDKHEARVLPNHMITLTPTMSPSETALKVTSSDPDVAVARLLNGVVQVAGRSEGTTMVIVSSVDGTAIPDTCMVTVYTENGDVNCDGFVNIADVTDLIDYLLSGNDDSVSQTNADCDKDGNVNIADVTTLIDYLLGGIDLNPPVTETFTVNGVTFKMVVVEGGTFTMGATAEQGSAWDGEYPTHQVTLSSYCIGETEVTQELWLAVMGSNPSYFTPSNGYIENLQRPVEYVSWNNCQTFINKLNELTGKNFRLPTEAEREYAARGGKRSQGYKYAGSNDINAVAWYCDNIPSQTWGNEGYGTQTVATKAPNELGLYDMSGNVNEWCQDWYGSYSSEAQTNPTGPVSGSYRVYRGGGWSYIAGGCRVSFRGSLDPTRSEYYVGLRLAL